MGTTYYRYWGRNYKITIVTPDLRIVTIQPPISISLSVNKNVMATANTCTLKIYNLGPETRDVIYKDKYTYIKYYRMTISAGYGDDLQDIFIGNIQEAYSYKKDTEWITEMKCFDGMYGIQNGYSNTTISKNVDADKTLRRLIKDMPNILAGAISLDALRGYTNKRGQVFVGQTSEIISTLTVGQYYIDNEKLVVLKKNEYLPTEAIMLDSDILFETPKRRDSFLECETIFFPKATLGYGAKLDTKEKVYNGLYVIKGFNHTFEYLSGSAGNAKSTLMLWAGGNALRRANVSN